MDDDDEDGNPGQKIIKVNFLSTNGLIFESDDKGNIKCGKCQKKFIRIISHLKNACNGAISIEELETLRLKVDKFTKEKWRQKAKSKDPQKFTTKKREEQQRWRLKAKSENPEKYTTNTREQQQKWRHQAKSNDPQKFMTNHKREQQNFRHKAKSENPEKFATKKREEQQRWRQKAKSDNPEKFITKKREQQESWRIKKLKNVGSWKRLCNFRRATKYGPIFVCSSCHQKLFEHEVVILEKIFENEINKKYDGAFSKYVDEKIPVCIFINEKNKLN